MATSEKEEGGAKKKAAEEKPAEKKKAQPKTLFLHHMARDPEARAARRLRPTNALDFLLEGGRRIRRKGNRLTELAMDDAVKNTEKLVYGVKHKYIEVFLDGDKKERLNHEELEALLSGGSVPKKPEKPAEKPGDKGSKGKTVFVSLVSVPTESKIRVLRELRDITGRDLGEVSELVEGLPKHVVGDLSREQAATIAERLNSVGATAAVVEEGGIKPDPRTPPPAPPALTVDDLLKMRREDLDKEAKAAGIEHPEKYSTKRELAEAMLGKGS